jgi:probable HAF family extracellular repeat protein
MHCSLQSAVLSLSVLLSSFVAAHAASYTFTTIAVPFSDVVYTQVRGINNHGQIVGFYTATPGNIYRGFLADGDVFSTLEVPGTSFTDVEGINDRGQIVGIYVDSNHQQHGFLYEGGVFSTIDIAGARFTQANGINNDGQIVGSYNYEPSEVWQRFTRNLATS